MMYQTFESSRSVLILQPAKLIQGAVANSCPTLRSGLVAQVQKGDGSCASAIEAEPETLARGTEAIPAGSEEDEQGRGGEEGATETESDDKLGQGEGG